MIGNAVPVNFAYCLAKQIYEDLKENKIDFPKIEIKAKPTQKQKEVFLDEKQQFEQELQALIPEKFRMKKSQK